LDALLHSFDNRSVRQGKHSECKDDSGAAASGNGCYLVEQGVAPPHQERKCILLFGTPFSAIILALPLWLLGTPSWLFGTPSKLD
jgi:hypothetical protein